MCNQPSRSHTHTDLPATNNIRALWCVLTLLSRCLVVPGSMNSGDFYQRNSHALTLTDMCAHTRCYFTGINERRVFCAHKTLPKTKLNSTFTECAIFFFFCSLVSSSTSSACLCFSFFFSGFFLSRSCLSLSTHSINVLCMSSYFVCRAFFRMFVVW